MIGNLVFPDDEFGQGSVVVAYRGARRRDLVRYHLSPPMFGEYFDYPTPLPEKGILPYAEPTFAIVFVRDPSAGDLVGDGRITGSLEEMSKLGRRLRCVMELRASTDEVIGRLRSVVGGDLVPGLTLHEFAASPDPVDGPCIPRTPALEVQVRKGFAARPEVGPVLPLVLRLAGFTEDPSFDVAVLEVIEDAVALLSDTGSCADGPYCTMPPWVRDAVGLLEERVELASLPSGRPVSLEAAEAALRRLSLRLRGR